MSTIAAAIKNGQIAIAADSQISSAYGGRKEAATYVVNHQKIFHIGDSVLALVGPASGELALQKVFSSLEEQPKFHSIREIYDVWSDLHRKLKADFFLFPNEDSDEVFESTRMDTMIVNATGLYSASGESAVQQFSRFFAIGSGEDYALGAMFVAWQDETKSAEQIARLGVEAAAEWNTQTGAPILSHSLTLNP